MTIRDVAALTLIVASAVVSWHLSRYVQPPPPVPRVDTVRVAADAPEPREGTPPETRTVYRVRTDTVQQACLSLPTDLPTQRLSLVQPLPVQIDGRRVTLRRYDVQAQRYVEDAWRVPRESWALSPVLRTDLMQGTYAATIGARLTYKNLSASLGYRVTPDHTGAGVGIRWTPYTLRW